MGKITSVGSFRGDVIAQAFGPNNSGLPQFTLKLTATEWYDAESSKWVDFAGADENDVTAYLILFSKQDKPIFHTRDLMELCDWDGKDFGYLNTVDLSDGIQFRVEENDYNDKITYKVASVSKWDDSPGGVGLRKASDADIALMNAKYGGALAKVAAELGKKATAAKPKTKKAPKTTKKTTAPPKKSTAGYPDTAAEAKAMTQAAAWGALIKVQPAEIPDDKLAEIWLAKIETVGGGTDSDDFTEEQWGDVFKAVEIQLIEDTCPY